MLKSSPLVCITTTFEATCSARSRDWSWLYPPPPLDIFAATMDQPDILLNVLSLLDRPTLAACLRVSREFYTLAGPLLYRHLRVSFWRGPSPLHGLEHFVAADTPRPSDSSDRRKHRLLRYTTTLNLGNHHLHCAPYFDAHVNLASLRVLRVGSDPFPLTLCAVRGPRCPLWVQLNPTKLVLSTYHPLRPQLPIGAGAVLPPSVHTVVLLEKSGTGITPWPELGHTFLETPGRANLNRVEIVFLTPSPDERFAYISPCPAIGECWMSDPSTTFWDNLARTCADFDGEITVVNANGFDLGWLGLDIEEDVAAYVEGKIRLMLSDHLDRRGARPEEIEARSQRLRFEGMREWLRGDWSGVVEPEEVQGWL
ncbi:hypothetical protein EHS25_008527 [Saitozyma podzolica]|uniref:F-box domain-containing protein n=1 Tax=Saitozyma podzolica TaxID=1890683 RepID=A0A427YLX0_9TREE|nr:hypothetical protein EHS25_008527 [Saitozyma podzolica]